MTDNNHAATLKIRGGVEIDSYGKKAGKGPLVQWELSGTLGASQDQTLFVWRDATTPVETGGQTAPTISGDHQNRVTDYTAIVLERHEE